MSRAISYDQFCKQYSLDNRVKKSKAEYSEYCEKLNFVNSAFADKTTSEALAKAKTETK